MPSQTGNEMIPTWKFLRSEEKENSDIICARMVLMSGLKKILIIIVYIIAWYYPFLVNSQLISQRRSKC